MLTLASASVFLVAAKGLAADTLADKETARAMFNEGNGFRDAGDPRAAIEKYKVSYALYPTPIIGLELGRAHAAIGELLEARQVLSSIEKLPLKGDQTGRAKGAREEARILSEQLATRIPSAKFIVPGIESTPTRIVKVDGVVVPNQVLTAPRRLNPGNHNAELFEGNATTPFAIVSFTLAEREAKEVTVAPNTPAQSQAVAPLPRQEAPTQPPVPAAPIQQAPMQTTTGVAPTAQPTAFRQPPQTLAPKRVAELEEEPEPKRPPTAHLHDRFYLRMGIGAGSTTHNWTEPGVGIDVNEVGALYELAGGWTVGNGAVLGLGLYGAYTNKERNGVTLTIATNVIGPMLDWYVSPTGGFHIQAALGGSLGTLTTTGAPEMSLSGAGLMLGAGYSAWIGNEWSCGGKLMILRTSTTGDDSGVEAQIKSTAVGALAEFTLN